MDRSGGEGRLGIGMLHDATCIMVLMRCIQVNRRCAHVQHMLMLTSSTPICTISRHQHPPRTVRSDVHAGSGLCGGDCGI